MTEASAPAEGVGKKLQEAKKAIAASEKKALAAARTRAFNLVAVVVVGSFCLYVFIVIAFVIAATFYRVEWKPAYDALLEIIKIAALPVTTTVIGYYAASR